jgi:hypothetical protein
LPRITKRVPGYIVALIAGTVGAALLHLAGGDHRHALRWNSLRDASPAIPDFTPA